jgi:hypothetical protein
MLNVRVRGIDTAIRDLVRTQDDVYDEARAGINAAAKHLMEKIIEKFGKYNPTGGDPGGHGGWRKLKFETIKKKSNRGYSTAPLIMTGETKGSFSVKEGGAGRLAASVHSSSNVLAYHVYGAPGANVPMRDPVRVTAKEEKDACHDIIEYHIRSAIRRSKL